jgi:hypothetical protein
MTCDSISIIAYTNMTIFFLWFYRMLAKASKKKQMKKKHYHLMKKVRIVIGNNTRANLIRNSFGHIY